MKKTTRVILLAIVAVMLLSFAPFSAYAAPTADSTITVGGAVNVQLSRDDLEHIIGFTAPEDGDYIIWSEAVIGDPCLYLYDGERADDDSGYLNNFKYKFSMHKGETICFKVKNYSAYNKFTGVVKLDVPTVPESIMTDKDSVVMDGIDFEEIRFAFGRGSDEGTIDFKFILDEGYEPVHYSGSDYLDFYASSSFDGKVELYCVEDPSVKKVIDLKIILYENKEKEIFLNTPVTQKGDSVYHFEAPADGYYAFSFTADSEDFECEIDTPDFSNYIGGVKSETVTGYIAKGDHAQISVYTVGNCKVTVKNAVPATGFDIITERVPYVGDEVSFYAIPVNADGIEEPCTFSVKDDKGDITYENYNSIDVVFDEPGTYTVNVVGNDSGKTGSKTVTVKERKALTLTTPFTTTLEKYKVNWESSKDTALFEAPEDGYYVFEIKPDTDDVSIASSAFTSPHGDVIEQQMEKGDGAEIEFYAYGNHVGNIGVTVTAKLIPSATAYSVPETVTVHKGEQIYVPFTLTPADSIFSYGAESADEDIAYVYRREDYIRIEGVEIGETTVEVLSAIGNKTINVKVIDTEDVTLDKEYVIDFSDLYIAAYKFKPQKTGFYTLVGYGTDIVVYDGTDEVANAHSGSPEAVYLTAGIEYMIAVEEKSSGGMMMMLASRSSQNGGGKGMFKITATKGATEVSAPGGVIYVPLGYEIYESDLFYGEYDAAVECIAKMVSSDNTVVKTSNNSSYPYVRAIKEGTATVTVETVYGLKTSFKVVVIPNRSDYEYGFADIVDALATLKATESITLDVELDGDGDVLWASSDETIATVDKNGKVTAKKPGKVVIYAKYGYATDHCLVTVTEPEIKDTTKIFKDVEAGRWYVNAINYNYSYGFIAGMSEDTFGVSNQITRGQFITILARIAGVDTSAQANKTTTKFTDVESGRFYTAAIKWASDNKIVAGMTDTTFAPTAPIQRQQLCVMIVNFSKNQKIGLTAAESAVTFADAADIGNYAKEAVAVCQRADIINGYNEGGKLVVKPANTATRAEAAQILYKFHKDFVSK